MARATKRRAPSAAQLQMEIDKVADRAAAPVVVPTQPAPTFAIDRIVSTTAQPAQAFGRWLLAQRSRTDWVADLVKAAHADRGFPKDGSPDDVRKRLAGFGAEGDVFEQVDDAERDWLGG